MMTNVLTYPSFSFPPLLFFTVSIGFVDLVSENSESGSEPDSPKRPAGFQGFGVVVVVVEVL